MYAHLTSHVHAFQFCFWLEWTSYRSVWASWFLGGGGGHSLVCHEPWEIIVVFPGYLCGRERQTWWFDVKIASEKQPIKWYTWFTVNVLNCIYIVVPYISNDHIWMLPKIGVPKMDGENNGSKPYEQMDDLGVPLFLETPMYDSRLVYIVVMTQLERLIQLLKGGCVCDFMFPSTWLHWGHFSELQAWKWGRFLGSHHEHLKRRRWFETCEMK